MNPNSADEFAQGLEVRVKRHESLCGLDLPQYMSAGASALDLVAAIHEDLVIAPGSRALVPTGLSIALPMGTEAQIRPRSGLALKHGITLLNSPGTIDADYRGEIKVILINLGEAPFVVSRGMRIAQMVIAEVIKARLVEADNLDETVRGSGGFGHTGVH